MAARRFLYFVAALVVVVLAGAVAYRMLGTQILRATLVPSAGFVAQAPPAQGEYAALSMWYARPEIGRGNPALWTPPGYAPAADPPADVFFIHPTSYLSRTRWNAPLDDADASWRARLFVRSQASAFNGVGRIWAPRYRQATFGAFLTSRADADRALDAAYRDVAMAFDEFLAETPADRPIILAAHSQGSLHLIRLLREKVAGRPVARRIVAVYAIGWPISIATDLPTIGLPACARAGQSACILSWQSFAEPAGTDLVTDHYDPSSGFDGRPRRGTAMLCVNPLTGAAGGAAPASANLGTLYPSADLTSATIAAGRVSARCDARGFLLIGEPPAGIGGYVLPGNNYHVFDYALFWANIRADAGARLATFENHRK